MKRKIKVNITPIKKIQRTDIEKSRTDFDVPRNLNEFLVLAQNIRDDPDMKRPYGVNCDVIIKLIEPVQNLVNLIGMTQLKDTVLSMIMYYTLNLHTKTVVNKNGDLESVIGDGDILHTVLYGPPGVGKTTVASILAKIYVCLGFLSSDKVIFAKKVDFVGQFIGHTENKTEALLEKAKGCVLFIDEVYSFGSNGYIDTFAKIAVDMLNQALSENKRNFVCMIAGYEKDIEENFFSINSGLKSRFVWQFNIETYSASELKNIFIGKIRKEGWDILEDELESFFSKNVRSFEYFGRDIEVFFTKCKISHAQRIWGKMDERKKLLNSNDIEEGLKLYLQNRKSEENSLKGVSHIYA